MSASPATTSSRLGRPEGLGSSIPDAHVAAIASRLQRAGDERVVERIWARDATLWAPAGTPEVADRLGWLTVADDLRAEAGALLAWARELGEADVVLLGMGGSSLAPEVLRRSFGAVRLHVLDSTDPAAIRAIEAAVDVERAVFVVSSKSGSTIETMSHFAYFWARTGGAAGRFVAVTDPGSPLAALAAEHGFRRTFANDPEIGGRYSALSYFGMVPAALGGIDVAAVLQAAARGERACRTEGGNPGLWLGCALGELALAGRDKLTLVLDEPLESLGLWIEQLVAESTGKQGRGLLPVADEPLGEGGWDRIYGPDRVFLHVPDADRPDAANAAALDALRAAGQPVLTLPASGPADLGRIFFVLEFATAVLGWALGINPFDQPNVQEAKDATQRVLAEPGDEPTTAAPRELLAGVAPPAYVAILAYLPPSDELDAAAATLRQAIRAATGAATTFGYGPRYLHSTGQYHKGGPPQGVFLELVRDAQVDLEVPGRPFTFGRLERAQALGDLRTLRAHGLPVSRAILDGDPAAAVGRLITELEA